MSLSDGMKMLKDAMDGNDVGGVNQRVFNKMQMNERAMSMSFAANVSGSTGRTCPCGCNSWSDHWNNGSGKTLSSQKCSVRMCGQAASVGAHIHLSEHGNTQYIIPFCGTHNGSSVTIAMALKPDVTVIAAYQKV